MKRLLTLILTAILVMGTIAGCSNNNSVDSKEAKNDKLIVYTNSGSNGRAEWLKERASKEGFDLEIVSIQGSDLANRIIAEKNNSQVDVIFGLNALEYEKIKKEELLMKYDPKWSGDVDMSLGDPEGYYYPIVVQPLVLMYNNEYKDAPIDWTNLVDPKYKDKYTFLSLGGGTGKAIYASILTRYLDANGEYGVSEEGWNIAKKIIQNAHMQIEGEDNVGDVINGTRPMTSMWGSGVIQNQNERNYKFGIMTPEIGVPYVVEQVAICSKTEKSELAQKFVNWFGSVEIQSEWSNKFGTIPAQPKALEKASDDVKNFMSKVHPQAIDWAVAAKNIDKWVEKAELEFIK